MTSPRTFKDIRELCYCESPPSFVTLQQDALGCDDIELTADTILELKDKVMTGDGDIAGLNCRVDDQNDNDGRTITLPMHFVGSFTETFSYQQLHKRYIVADLIKEFKLPINVQFLSNTEKNSSYGPHLGLLTLERKRAMNSILATTIIDNVRHALTFSAELPVTIQVATGIKKSPYRYPNSQSQVDLKKFDYCSPSDPYSGVTLQTFDDLHTPMIPRRGSTPRMYNRTRSSTDASSRYSSTTSVPELPKKTQSTSTIVKNRNKSLDLGKNFENFFKFKGLRKSMSSKIGKDKNGRNKQKSQDELDETRSFIQSDDGHSTTDLLSIAPTSNGSDSIGNESFSRITECMEAMTMSIDQTMTPGRRRRHSRKGSGDSGICLSGRKHPRSRSLSRSRSRMSPDAPSSNPSDTIDTFSEWSLPMNLKDSPSSGRKTYSSQGGSSSSYLWGVDSNLISTEQENQPATDDYQTDFLTNQNTINMMNFHNTEKDKSNEVENNKTTNQDLSPLTSRQLESINEIRQLNEDGVCRVLETLNFYDFKDIFTQNQINGELLLDLEIDDLVNDLKLSLFQAKKIVKYIKGWRPQSEDRQITEASRRNSLNPRDWSENDVLLHMTTINLIDFGNFCIKNQVNGDLLLDILDKETLNSLKNDHKVKISNLESKKLLNFVVKGWRPDVSPKKSALL
eukprot:TCONS_00018963-protein